MNGTTGKKNYYIYKWKAGYRGELEARLQPGDRFTVSLRDLKDPGARQDLTVLRQGGAECFCALPVLWKPGEGPAPEDVWEEVDGFYAGNIGQIRRLLDTGKPVMGDAGLNVFNWETAAFFGGIGLSGVTLSYELEAEAENEILSKDTSSGRLRRPPSPQGEGGGFLSPISHLPSPVSYELLRFGRVPAMISEYCPLAGAEGIRGSGCGRCREENPVWLKDFKGERYPILLEPDGCTSLILSRKPLDRPWADELAAERDDVIRRICIFE